MTIHDKIASKKAELESYLDSISKSIRDAEEALKGIPVKATVDAGAGYDLNWGPLGSRNGTQRIFVTGLIEACPLIECTKELRAQLVPYLNDLLVKVDEELEIYLKKVR